MGASHSSSKYSRPGRGSDDALRRLDVLTQVAFQLARTTPSGRVLLARIGQAIDTAWIPQPWGSAIVAELVSAQEAASEPMKLKGIEHALRDAWGTRPTNELDDLDPEPVAVTPTSQVHRGMLEADPVAVKVLRPWLASEVRRDLPVLEGLLVPLEAAFPALDSRAILREFRERVLDEFDLEHEACTQRLVHRALRGHPSLMAPAPVMRLAHEGVLVSEWVDGTPLLETRDPDDAAARLLEFALGATRAGIMPADIDPDDVLLQSDGRLAILDFGAWCEVDGERVSIAADALDAFLEHDVEAFGRAVERLRWLPASHGGAALGLIREALGGLAGPGPALLDTEAVLAARDRLFESPETIVELILTGTLPPHDLWPARGVAQLFGTIARVGATGDWPALARAALRNGWAAR